MPQTLPNGAIVPLATGEEDISETGVEEIRRLGASIDTALAGKVSLDALSAALAFAPAAIVFDDFNRAAGSLGTPTSGGTGWAATAGTGTTGIAIRDNAVRAWTGSGNSHAYVPAGLDVIVTATVKALAASPIAGLVARYIDDVNHLVVQLRESATVTTYTVSERRGSTALYPLVTSTVIPKIGDVFGVRVVGSTVELIVNGAVIGAGTHSRTGTLAGLYFNGDDQVTAFDDFTVTGA